MIKNYDTILEDAKNLSNSLARKMQQANEFAGKQLIKYRLKRGMSQEQLAKAIGCSFQQVQKYESAINRISIPRLVLIASVLNVKPRVFFYE